MSGARIPPERYRQLDLHAHAILHDVPLHDVWEVRLPGGRPGLGLGDVRPLFSLDAVGRRHPAVRLLFALRGWLGRVFRWDAAEGAPPRAESAHLRRVPEALRARSDPPPGTPEGPFRILYALERESLSEIRNATVHAFSVMALREAEDGEGYRATWAVHVAPVGAVTRLYMALIDPFRRWLIYPAILRHVEQGWSERFGAAARGSA